MEMRQYDDADAIKDRLEIYLETEREIDKQIERLERLQTKLIGVGAQVITDMPKSHSSSTDRYADIISQKEELEVSVRQAIQEQSEVRKYFENIVKHLRNPDEKSVIRMRYFDRAEWDEVVEMMFGDKEDFEDRLDTFERRCYRLRRNACIHMAEYMRATGSPDMAILANL